MRQEVRPGRAREAHADRDAYLSNPHAPAGLQTEREYSIRLTFPARTHTSPPQFAPPSPASTARSEEGADHPVWGERITRRVMNTVLADVAIPPPICA
ncbi:hypothetical protein HNQ64_000289 [Prosthecobacter dejongeii]|uniref:Uncharacterized protein n=1 Tax=Prosthecobacter dejongeii TaxID=48465 RepID=A0A7W7YH15_9BACT|nr:hypothetical protein [Prosthecobacter dejongeii]